jgi:prolyl-tRNA editing enzyme YbaK/EbsC (Cys-tRNA(Pro) deacylase)
MSDTLPEIRMFLEQAGLPFEVWPCDPELADTAVFCEHYGVALENSANAILVRSKTGTEKFVLCVLLATDRLNTNHTVRKKMGARKVSFASADETRELTAVMQCEYIVLGGGNRSCKLKVDPRVLIQQPAAEIVAGLASHRVSGSK